MKFRAADKHELRRKLVQSFRFNIDRLKQMQEQLTKPPQVIPDFRLDVGSVSHVLFNGRDLFDDQTWFDRFNWQRFQLIHINSKCDYLANLYAASSSYPMSQGEASKIRVVVSDRYASLVDQVAVTGTEIEQLLAEYEKSA